MARKTEAIVTLTDDLDGSKADRTVEFSFDGTNYELELSKKNAVALEKVLGPYIGAARKVRGSGAQRRVGVGGSRNASRNDLASIRAWAKQNGMDVSEWGRVARSVQDAYDAAH